MFQKSNPISYKLAQVRTERDLRIRRKQVRLIFQSIMKRVKAAYNFQVKQLEGSRTLDPATIKYRLWEWAEEARKWEEGCNTLYNNILDDYLTPSKPGWGSDDLTRSFADIANSYIKATNAKLVYADTNLRHFVSRAYKHPRNLQEDSWILRTHREQLITADKKKSLKLRELFMELKASYPYIREKYRARLAKKVWQYYSEEMAKGGKSLVPRALSHADIYYMYHLVKLGIPAADVVGPWWPRVQGIKSPMDFIDYMGRHSEVRISPEMTRSVYDYKSPTPKDWLGCLDLDSNDPQLVASVQAYYNHHKSAPSASWARQRSNELEEERKKADADRLVNPVRDWLKVMKHAREITPDVSIVMPPLLGKWRIAGPSDAQELCERASRDGMCVADVLSRLSLDSEDEEDCVNRSSREGVCTILFSTDPKCRTIVGLNEVGICTSDHHCTGKNNEVDEDAYEYFKKPHGQF